jgi:putative intracellular protease/amidase
MSQPEILIILTSHAAMGDTGEPTGYWLEELLAPYYAFVDAGANVTIASIKGGLPPVDPSSLTNDLFDRYEDDALLHVKLKNSHPVADINAGPYDAVFLPGGHGTMWDLPDNQALATLISTAWADNKIVAAVCHGVAGLLNAKTQDGAPLVKGRKLTAFSNDEESVVGLADKVPFLLEDKLKAQGAVYESASPLQPKALRDGNLITGQNPVSSAPAAQLVLKALSERAQKQAATG